MIEKCVEIEKKIRAILPNFSLESTHKRFWKYVELVRESAEKCEYEDVLRFYSSLGGIEDEVSDDIKYLLKRGKITLNSVEESKIGVLLAIFDSCLRKEVAKTFVERCECRR